MTGSHTVKLGRFSREVFTRPTSSSEQSQFLHSIRFSGGTVLFTLTTRILYTFHPRHVPSTSPVRSFYRKPKAQDLKLRLKKASLNGSGVTRKYKNFAQSQNIRYYDSKTVGRSKYFRFSLILSVHVLNSLYPRDW